MKNKKKYNIGLTGSNGFIGSAILNHFKSNNDNVVILDSIVSPNTEKNDIVIPEILDWILHFGATKSIETSFENPINLYQRNMRSTMAALDIALSKNSRFLYMSSYVYGHPYYLPVDEKHPVAVLNPYMGSKLLGEHICHHFHQLSGISALILRGFTFYGPHQKDDQLISSIIQSIRNNRAIVVRDPNPKRDYLHIADLMRLLDRIIRSNFSGYEVYNVGGGKAYKNIKVAQMANNLAGNSVPIHIKGKQRRNDVAECYANIEKVKIDFQWQPEIDLSSGLKDCLS